MAHTRTYRCPENSEKPDAIAVRLREQRDTALLFAWAVLAHTRALAVMDKADAGLLERLPEESRVS